MFSTPILSIVGKSKSGKTTLLEKIIVELKRRGYHIATIKHHSHPGFEIDVPGKDTWRHAQAGSDIVVIAAPDKIATIQKLVHELNLDDIAASLPPVDIILTEGYKQAGKPTLEVLRAARGLEIVSDLGQLVGIATDTRLDVTIPQFNLNEPEPIVDFIENTFILKR